MRSRNKSSKKSQAPSIPHVAAAKEQDIYEGDRLNFLLQSIQRNIETARTMDGDVLPERIWLEQQFAVGVNEVTRLLEWTPPSKGSKLQAVLVASDCNPKWLIRHLPSLASSRKVPLIFIKDKKLGSLRLGRLIKLKTALAVGIKHNDNAVNHFIDKILNGGDFGGNKECLEPEELAGEP